MFGNKFSGDNIAKEFFKISTIKKMASEHQTEEPEYKNHASDEVVDPAQFLQKLDDSKDIVEKEIEQRIEDLDSWADDQPAEAKAEDCEVDYAYDADDCEVDYLMDAKASEVLSGLGKIAGSLRLKNENFAADLVEATAIEIKKELIKEASKKIEVISELKKIASEISASGDQFAADMVEATILKIKNN